MLAKMCTSITNALAVRCIHVVWQVGWLCMLLAVKCKSAMPNHTSTPLTSSNKPLLHLPGRVSLYGYHHTPAAAMQQQYSSCNNLLHL